MLRSNVVLCCEILLILNFFTLITCESSYTVTAPGTIRSNRKYSVSATLHNVSQPAKFLIGIRDNFAWSDKQTILLQPMETKLLQFFPPKLDKNKQYELFVQGSGGVNFSNSTHISVGRVEGVVILVETDRGTYRPGDLLQFRVVILDEHSRPVKMKEPIKVQIFDSAGNRVKQFKDISLNRGVYRNIFQLSKDPLLGSWSIKVFIAGRYSQEKSVKFEVAKYTLPKFFVNIETDSTFIYGQNSFLKVTVYAQYTYNKLVEGKVDLRVRQPHMGFKDDIAHYTANTVDSRASFAINYNNIKRKVYSDRLVLNASLTEMHTGIVQFAIADIQIRDVPHEIDFLDNEMEFKDGKPFRIKVRVLHWNNTAVTDTEGSVFMETENIKSAAKLNENGVATFESDFFKAYAPATFSYKASTRRFNIPLMAGAHLHNGNCELRIKNKSPQLSIPIDILVQYAENIPYLVYTLTSHGNILKSEFVHMQGNQKSHTIQLLPSNEMVPTSFLYVHFMYAGRLTFCEIKIKLPEKLENEITVSAPKDVKPGEKIKMALKTQPNSTKLNETD